jgi:hypothetical protein
VDEAILDKEDLPLDKRDDWEEVQNYTKAMEWAIDHLKELAKAKKVMDYLYNRPIIAADKVSEIASISMPSTYKLISDLKKLNVFKRNHRTTKRWHICF